MKISNPANDKLINRTISLWQTRYERDLSRADAGQIVENVTGLFLILNEWSQAETVPTASDNREPTGVDQIEVGGRIRKDRWDCHGGQAPCDDNGYDGQDDINNSRKTPGSNDHGRAAATASRPDGSILAAIPRGCAVAAPPARPTLHLRTGAQAQIPGAKGNRGVSARRQP